MALTVVADFNGGAVSSTLVNSHAKAIQEVQPLYATKAADESRTSNVTLSDDADLFVIGAANATYEVTFMGRTTGAGSATLGDISVQWTYPTGSGAQFSMAYMGLTFGVAYGVSTAGSVNAITVLGTTSPSAAVSFGTPSTNYSSLIGKGLWVVGQTAGVLRLQWAQRVSTGTSTKLGQGSFLALSRVS